MRTTRPTPKLLFTEQEQRIYDSYIASYKRDYPGMTQSDLIQLEQAGVYHILAIRLVGKDIEQDTRQWSQRYHPRQLERGILQDLALTRKDRLATRPVVSTEEDEMRELLLSIGKQPEKVKSNGR